MEEFALLARLETRSGKEKEIEQSTFEIFDTFKDEARKTDASHRKSG